MVAEVSVDNVKAFISVLNLYKASSAAAQEAFKDLIRIMREEPTDELLIASY